MASSNSPSALFFRLPYDVGGSGLSGPSWDGAVVLVVVLVFVDSVAEDLVAVDSVVEVLVGDLAMEDSVVLLVEKVAGVMGVEKTYPFWTP